MIKHSKWQLITGAQRFVSAVLGTVPKHKWWTVEKVDPPLPVRLPSDPRPPFQVTDGAGQPGVEEQPRKQWHNVKKKEKKSHWELSAVLKPQVNGKQIRLDEAFPSAAGSTGPPKTISKSPLLTGWLWFSCFCFSYPSSWGHPCELWGGWSTPARRRLGLPPPAQWREPSRRTHWKQILTYHLKLDYFFRSDLGQRLRGKRKDSNLITQTEGFNVFQAHGWCKGSLRLCWSSFCHLKLWWDTCCLPVQTTPRGLSWVPAWSSRHLEENTSREETLNWNRRGQSPPSGSGPYSHFFKVMTTLPDVLHFWNSRVSSVRNCRGQEQAISSKQMVQIPPGI